MSLRSVVLVTTLLLLSGPAARAQSAATQDQARAHFEQGLTHYNLAEWDEAITEFKKAYELSHAPGLLYNVAQAQRLKGDKRAAITTYRSYLRLDPYATNRAEAEAHVAELEKSLAEEQKAAKPPPPPAAPPPSPGSERVMRVDANVMRVEVKEQKRPQLMMRAGLITAGAGVVVLGVGTYFGVRARQNWNEVETVDEERQDWGTDPMGSWDDAQTQESLAKILIGVGAVTVVTGGVLYVLGSRASSGSSLFGATPVRGGGLVGVTSTW